jgi:GGDEF domain-containing protein
MLRINYKIRISVQLMGATSMFLVDKQKSKQIMKRADTAMYKAKKKTQ